MSHTEFIDAHCQGQHAWPRVLGTLVLTAAGAALVMVPLRVWALPWLQANAADMLEPMRSGVLALLAGLTFAGALAGLLVGVRVLHRRSVRSVVTRAPRFRWAQLALGSGLSALMVGCGAWMLDPGSVKPLSAIDPGVLLLSGVAMLVGFSIQAPAEEVIFRGYILQVARRAFRSRRAAALLSVALFTLVHAGYGIESALASLTFAIGLTACVLMLGGLEFAMGAHVANNLVVAFLFQDLSKANAPTASGIAWAELCAEALIMLVLVTTAWFLRRRENTLLERSSS